MLAVSRDTVRLLLHVLAATIWVGGGQLVLAALLPALARSAQRCRGRPPAGSTRTTAVAATIRQAVRCLAPLVFTLTSVHNSNLSYMQYLSM